MALSGGSTFGVAAFRRIALRCSHCHVCHSPLASRLLQLHDLHLLNPVRTWQGAVPKLRNRKGFYSRISVHRNSGWRRGCHLQDDAQLSVSSGSRGLLREIVASLLVLSRFPKKENPFPLETGKRKRVAAGTTGPCFRGKILGLRWAKGLGPFFALTFTLTASPAARTIRRFDPEIALVLHVSEARLASTRVAVCLGRRKADPTGDLELSAIQKKAKERKKAAAAQQFGHKVYCLAKEWMGD